MEMTVNGNAYEVVTLLGKGKGGYSYLVRDEAGEYVLKQIHHEPCDYYQFGDKLASELHDYETLSRVGVPMPKLLAVDHAQERILKAYIPGKTVYELVLEDGVSDHMITTLHKLCQTLYANGLNIDYFPTNFVCKDNELHYVDYECNGYMEQWDFAHWGIRYWSKTPEFLEYARNRGDL